MREFMLGFFVALSLSMASYIVWENYRHVPVVIQQVPVPMQSVPTPPNGSQFTNN